MYHHHLVSSRYSFNHGPIHFTVISTENPLDADSEQVRARAASIKEELSVVPPSFVPWCCGWIFSPFYNSLLCLHTYLSSTPCLARRGPPPSPSSSSLQYKFIAADFATVKRTETPWLVLIGHRPMYIDCDGIACDKDREVAKYMREALQG